MKIYKVKSIVIAVVVAVVAAGAATGFALHESGSGDVTMTAMFPDASPIIPGNIVRASGVQVGEIKSVNLRHGKAAVQMELTPAALPLHRDATAKIRPVTLLGERFVELDRGSPNAPLLPPGGVIQPQQTSRSVDLDQVLNSLDNPTSTALAALATTLGEGVGGRGKNVDAALRALAPAMQNTQKLGKVLNQQNSVLADLVDRASPVASAAAGRNGKQLDHAVNSAKQMLHAIGTQQQALRGAVDELPGTLKKAQHVLSQAAGVADAGTPVLRGIRPTTDNLSQISDELNRFANSATPALASLPPVLDKAKKLLDQAKPAVRSLRPGADALPGISHSARHLVGALTPAMKTALDFIKYWAMSTNGRDALGNYFRAFVVTTPKSLLQIPGVGVPDAKGKAAASPSAAKPGKPATAAQDGASGAAPHAGSAAGSGGSATGLDSKQEGSLVDQLLGGQ